MLDMSIELNGLTARLASIHVFLRVQSGSHGLNKLRIYCKIRVLLMWERVELDLSNTHSLKSASKVRPDTDC